MQHELLSNILDILAEGDIKKESENDCSNRDLESEDDQIFIKQECTDDSYDRRYTGAKLTAHKFKDKTSFKRILCNVLEDKNLHSRIQEAAKPETKSYVCDLCSYQTNKPRNIARHKKSVHEGINYSCSACNYQSAQENNVKVHYEKKHEGKRYK